MSLLDRITIVCNAALTWVTVLDKFNEQHVLGECFWMTWHHLFHNGGSHVSLVRMNDWYNGMWCSVLRSTLVSQALRSTRDPNKPLLPCRKLSYIRHSFHQWNECTVDHNSRNHKTFLEGRVSLLLRCRTLKSASMLMNFHTTVFKNSLHSEKRCKYFNSIKNNNKYCKVCCSFSLFPDVNKTECF